MTILSKPDLYTEFTFNLCNYMDALRLFCEERTRSDEYSVVPNKIWWDELKDWLGTWSESMDPDDLVKIALAMLHCIPDVAFLTWLFGALPEDTPDAAEKIVAALLPHHGEVLQKALQDLDQQYQSGPKADWCEKFRMAVAKNSKPLPTEEGKVGQGLQPSAHQLQKLILKRLRPLQFVPMKPLEPFWPNSLFCPWANNLYEVVTPKLKRSLWGIENRELMMLCKAIQPALDPEDVRILVGAMTTPSTTVAPGAAKQYESGRSLKKRKMQDKEDEGGETDDIHDGSTTDTDEFVDITGPPVKTSPVHVTG
jgi:hypothetical protein